MTKQIKYKNTNYKLELWDTAGQEKYRSLIKGYLKGADVCIFVYDASSNYTLKQDCSPIKPSSIGFVYFSQSQPTSLSR